MGRWGGGGFCSLQNSLLLVWREELFNNFTISNMWNFSLALYKLSQFESSVSSSDHENLYWNFTSPWKRCNSRPPSPWKWNNSPASKESRVQHQCGAGCVFMASPAFTLTTIFSHHPWIEGCMNTLFSSHSHRALYSLSFCMEAQNISPNLVSFLYYLLLSKDSGQLLTLLFAWQTWR